MIKLVLLAILVSGAGCKKQDDRPAPPRSEIQPAEAQRGRDACKAYVEKVCKCAETVTVPEVVDGCKLGKAYPEAIDVGMQTVANMNSKNDEVKNAAEAVRKTVATCISETAKLPSLGCAP